MYFVNIFTYNLTIFNIIIIFIYEIEVYMIK